MWPPLCTIGHGLPDPSTCTWSFLNQVLKGIRRSYPAHTRPPHLPITPHILGLLFTEWSRAPVSQDDLMLWAACCTGFFGFLRSGEFTCPSAEAYSDGMLSPADVRVDSHSNPSIVSLHLRQSKMDIFGMGVWVHMGLVDGPICPVKALLGYLTIRGYRPLSC